MGGENKCEGEATELIFFFFWENWWNWRNPEQMDHAGTVVGENWGLEKSENLE